MAVPAIVGPVVVLGCAFRGLCGEVFVTRQSWNGDGHSSTVDAGTDVMGRDDATAELFAFPHTDFFRETVTGTERELAGNRPVNSAAPRTVATGRPGHQVVS
ncbi:hypothetical protein AB0B83_11520 [Micromonospora sp. NPDC049060]|uniref:hypothetical protein n=1 Tax=unclassified Micromonospora TaxID=2617518 RepID=UPI0033CAD95B